MSRNILKIVRNIDGNNPKPELILTKDNEEECEKLRSYMLEVLEDLENSESEMRLEYVKDKGILLIDENTGKMKAYVFCNRCQLPTSDEEVDELLMAIFRSFPNDNIFVVVDDNVDEYNEEY